jgi:hypothetical protein
MTVQEAFAVADQPTRERILAATAEVLGRNGMTKLSLSKRSHNRWPPERGAPLIFLILGSLCCWPHRHELSSISTTPYWAR